MLEVVHEVGIMVTRQVEIENTPNKSRESTYQSGTQLDNGSA